jgi:hypothetical protein
MSRKIGLKTKRIKAGARPFISKGKPQNLPDNSAAGSLFEVGPERHRSPPGRKQPRRACSVREGALWPVPGAML